MLTLMAMGRQELFDDWPERYERWFATPIGRLVREVETGLINDLLQVKQGEFILDAGCGTGIFTGEFLNAGAKVVGLDISAPMLDYARRKFTGRPFSAVQSDMLHLPFKNESFDKTVSITAIEFIPAAQKAIDELFRVTKPGGLVVVATLNSLSPWAERRRAKTASGQKHVLENACYWHPDELLACSPFKGITMTCVHFQKYDVPAAARITEAQGQLQGLNTGAFVAARWVKPT